ncbi:ubiquinone biosynthesis UbiH/UbiF/VisC/COQ6 family hydroxylase [Pseudomonas sp. URMO17WK12:I1]|uniref:5-demethoxyubiquinol-8 5-hydroxylase UbiM n=1 Tax=unclassified Pseudomonas TaxID=196821 RepID=UPI0004829C73|nr:MULTISPECIES: 5-demethoxyubiquinol-8 5-hydroxylase UbiM [unclassified Pseudomonas]PZW71551.1 ubiquinone biosynthesis UbiH/UbiF/VisC/COQ6 family hydroxylase [Pseudomonas sp. URMO17WK12:I1]
MKADVVIVGAGPAGLCLARSLSGQGLSICLIERQTEAELAVPPFDGREIALTHASQQILEKLGIWQQFTPEDISPLRDAQVLNGPSPYALRIAASAVGQERLGCLVPNQAIRRAAYDAASECADIHVLCERTISELNCSERGVSMRLSDGQTLEARLVVAADSRFSETRRRAGIGARMEDFGKTMLVCRMAHERSHEQVAWEWFGYGQTLALLPLNGNCASAVLTLPPTEMSRVMNLDDEAFAREMERRFDRRLGRMELIGERITYPLVGVYAERFAGLRSALVGDAAVGMHPVTAHGFNFGLQSQKRLADTLLGALRQGRDIGEPGVLQRYAGIQQRASWPLYQATSLLVRLYTDDRAPTRLLRNAGLRLAQNLPPFKTALARHLTQLAR